MHVCVCVCMHTVIVFNQSLLYKFFLCIQLENDWKCGFKSTQAGNMTNAVSESCDNFSERVEYHGKRSKLIPYSTCRAENQLFWILKLLPIHQDPSWHPKQPGQIQHLKKVQWTSPAKVQSNVSVYWSSSELLVCVFSDVGPSGKLDLANFRDIRKSDSLTYGISDKI